MTMQKEHPLKQPKHSRENVRITLNIAWPSIVGYTSTYSYYIS